MKKYNAVRDVLCEQHRDVPNELPKCFTSKAGKCPLANFYCFENASATDLILSTPPNCRGKLKKAFKKIAKDLGIEVGK